MSGETAAPTLIQQTPDPATPQVAGVQFAAGPIQMGPIPRNLSYNFPQSPSANGSKNLVNAVKALGWDMDAKGILNELKWQTKTPQ